MEVEGGNKYMFNEQQTELLKTILNDLLSQDIDMTTKAIINQIISKLENNG